MSHTIVESPAPAAPPPAVGPLESLPSAVGAWSRVGPPRRIEPGAIFDYMDGAGELYLAYRLDHLDVVEYGAGQDDDILVEVYLTASPDDAFGLLSGDWGGEPVALVEDSSRLPAWPTALYGAGLLRMRAGPLYVRIVTTRESDASRSAVLSIGTAIAAGRTSQTVPVLVAALPAAIRSATLRRSTVCLLRSHLVLNSSYFLSSENILDLGPEVAAVTAAYDLPTRAGAQKRARLVLVRYPDGRRAERAVDHFRRVYLPESRPAPEGTAPTAIEDGWAGSRRVGPCLAVVLECAEREDAVEFLEAGTAALEQAGGCHE